MSQYQRNSQDQAILTYEYFRIFNAFLILSLNYTILPYTEIIWFVLESNICEFLFFLRLRITKIHNPLNEDSSPRRTLKWPIRMPLLPLLGTQAKGKFHCVYHFTLLNNCINRNTIASHPYRFKGKYVPKLHLSLWATAAGLSYFSETLLHCSTWEKDTKARHSSPGSISSWLLIFAIIHLWIIIQILIIFRNKNLLVFLQELSLVWFLVFITF